MRDGRVQRGIEHHLRRLGGLAGNLSHHLDEAVERLTCLRLRRLYHQRLVEEKREVDCGSVEAEVKQALGHVERGDAGRLVGQAVEDKLVLAASRHGQLVEVLERVLDVVGVERGHRAGLGKTFGAEAEDVRQRAHLHSKVAEPAADAAESIGGVCDNLVLLVLLVPDHARVGQEFLQALAHAHGTAAGAAAAMRRRERLVQVDVHDVEAHVAGTRDTQHRVEVGSVVVHQAAGLVYKTGNLGDVLLEHAHGVGVGHHHCRHGVVELRAQVVDVDGAVGQTLDLDNPVPGDVGRGGVGAVGRVGDNDLVAGGVAVGVVVGVYDHQARQLAMGAGVRVEGELGHAADFAEELLKGVVGLKGALHRLERLRGMQTGGDGVGGNLLVDFGIVLHRARAQGIEASVNAEVVGA